MSLTTAPAHGRVLRGAVGGAIGAAVGIVLGFILGATIGGNWFSTVEMFGRTGYEATAQVGVVVGGVLFAAAGVWLAVRRRSTR